MLRLQVSFTAITARVSLRVIKWLFSLVVRVRPPMSLRILAAEPGSSTLY